MVLTEGGGSTRADIFDDYKSAPTPKQFAGYIKIFGGMFNSNWHALPVDMDCGEKEKAAVKRAKFHLYVLFHYPSSYPPTPSPLTPIHSRTLHNVSSLFTISSTRPPLINPLTRSPCTHPHEESAFHFLEPTVPIPFLSEVFNRGEITQMRTNFRRREAKLEPPLNLEDDEFLYMDEAEMVHYEDGIEVKRDRMVRRGGLGERDGEAIKGRQGVGRRRVAVADMGVPKVREGKKEEESSGEVETEEEFSESEDEEEENGEGEDSYKEEGRGTVRRRELEDQVEMEMMMDWFQKRKWY